MRTRNSAKSFPFTKACEANGAVLPNADQISPRCVSGIAFCQGRFSGLQGWCSIWGAQAVIPLVVYSKLSVPFWVKRAPFPAVLCHFQNPAGPEQLQQVADRAHQLDRKSTRLNSSHLGISYAVFCLKKNKTTRTSHTASMRRPPWPSATRAVVTN